MHLNLSSAKSCHFVQGMLILHFTDTQIMPHLFLNIIISSYEKRKSNKYPNVSGYICTSFCCDCISHPENMMLSLVTLVAAFCFLGPGKLCIICSVRSNRHFCFWIPFFSKTTCIATTTMPKFVYWKRYFQTTKQDTCRDSNYRNWIPYV